MTVPTITQPNFLTDREIWQIENIMRTTDPELNESGKEHGTHHADYFYMRLYDHPPHQAIADILLPKLRQLLDPNIYIDDCHIMDSFVPYHPHTDAITPVPRPGYEQAWTIIIPLDNYNSTTFIFEEQCAWTKRVMEWVERENIQPCYRISESLYQTYFTHSERPQFDYLTLHDFFPWRKGWVNATSRFRFHASDNYPSRNLKRKRAIVMWTSRPNG